MVITNTYMHKYIYISIVHIYLYIELLYVVCNIKERLTNVKWVPRLQLNLHLI